MNGLFESLTSERRHKFLIQSVSQNFLQPNTARMLRHVKADWVRMQLRKSIGDCKRLATSDQGAFERLWRNNVQKLGRRMPFGHAAKLVDLYIKTAINQRYLLTTQDTELLSQCAHCPIDSRVLKRLWHEFPEKMAVSNLRRNMPLKAIKPKQYQKIQQLLRGEACRFRCVALDYDFAYLDGSGEA